MTTETDVLEAPVKEQVIENQQVPAAAVSTWNLDGAHSSAAFSVKHMMIANVHGAFRELSGVLNFDRQNIEKSSLSVAIKSASVQTNDPRRDEHLKSAEFFEVEKYPEITFVSTNWAQKSDDEIDVIGNLTIHGFTKEVILKVEGPTAEVKDPWGGTRIGFSAHTKLNRKDFGLGWNVALETGGFVVGDHVTITLETQFVKA
jgi:polyisoprenoid-binding protein YceI